MALIYTAVMLGFWKYLATTQAPAASSINYALILLIVIMIGAGLILISALLILMGHRHRQKKDVTKQSQDSADPWNESAKRFEMTDEKSGD